jgi:hypothetical protein
MRQIRRIIYYYASDDEDKIIQDALDKAKETPSGKVRNGDVLKMVLLSWTRDGGKI